jgi:hypothetical protein
MGHRRDYILEEVSSVWNMKTRGSTKAKRLKQRT